MAISMIRTVIVFAAIVAAMRIMGKRELGQLEPAELVVSVLISDLASHPLQDPGVPLAYGLVPVITLVCVQVLLSGALLKSAPLRRLLCGRAAFIIRDGKIVQSEMRKNRMTVDELTQQLRKKDVFSIGDVRHAVVETDGSLSVILYPEKAPLTPAQMGISSPPEPLTQVLISDGRVLEQNLRALGRDPQWLKKQLAARGYDSEKDVFLLCADERGVTYCVGEEPS